MSPSISADACRPWFACPGGCGLVVTSLVRPAAEQAAHGQPNYSGTHCCLACQNGEGRHNEDWGCAGVPRCNFLEVPLCPEAGVGNGTGGIGETVLDNCAAHCIVHIPDSKEAQSSGAPAVLFLHGGVTYVYPETLWWDVRDLISNNTVVREQFVVIAPFATAGEPLAVVSSTREKTDRFGQTVAYVDDFDEEKVWNVFLSACVSLGPGRVDMSRLHAVGYSMGGQGVWNLAAHQGSRLASAVPFAGCCSWRGLHWGMEDAVFRELRDLPIRCYNGEADTGTHPWRDIAWLAARRGFSEEATKKSTESHADEGVELSVHEWGDSLQLCLVRGTQSAHCCWDVVLHNEASFGLFSWMAGLRRSPAQAQCNAAGGTIADG